MDTCTITRLNTRLPPLARRDFLVVAKYAANSLGDPRVESD